MTGQMWEEELEVYIYESIRRPVCQNNNEKQQRI
jgi:hypothetical protein